jgi:hypothetical protein
MSSMPDTRYAKSGDTYIAYQVMGDGPFNLVLVPGFITHLDRHAAGAAALCKFHGAARILLSVDQVR